MVGARWQIGDVRSGNGERVAEEVSDAAVGQQKRDTEVGTAYDEPRTR